MLEIHSLSVDYGPQRVLHSLDLQVEAGEVLAVIGPNGAGKTTLIRAASGVVPAQAGVVRAAGVDLSALSPHERARFLAVVPQARQLPYAFTVWQTVALGRTPYLGWLGHDRPQDREIVQWALQRADIQDLAHRRLGELSGGEQQLALLARALAQKTPVLLLDEPTAHLDLQHQSGLLNLVQELVRDQRLTVLMVLHDLNLASIYADRVALLVRGRIQALGEPGRVLTREHLSAAYNVPVSVIPHPEYGTPLILPDGKQPAAPRQPQPTSG